VDAATRQAGKLKGYCETIRSGSDLSGLSDVQTTNELMEVGVSFSVYDITVPVMVHGLSVMDDYLDKAQALERTKGFEPGRILGERLAPDMLTFGEQCSVSCNKVDAHIAKLMQRDPPIPRKTPMMYPALKGRLLETRGFLQTCSRTRLPAPSHTRTSCRRPSCAGGSAATTTSGTWCCRTSSSTSRSRTRSSGTLERRSGSATISATSLNGAAVTTRERRARGTARAEALEVMIFGPIFRVKVHFSGAILGAALLREQGIPASIRFTLRRFAGLRHYLHATTR
jgi:hypothetical protein